MAAPSSGGRVEQATRFNKICAYGKDALRSTVSRRDVIQVGIFYCVLRVS
jgi:hypothetical protein